MYICIKCLMYVILLGELKLVGTIFAFAIETKLKKNHQQWFFLSSRFSNFLLPSSPLLFIFGHCWFYTISWLMISSKVYGIIMSLNWIFFKKKHRFFNIWWSKVLILILGHGQIWLSQGHIWSTTLAGRQFRLLDVNHFTLSYIFQRPLSALKWGWVSNRGQPYI